MPEEFDLKKMEEDIRKKLHPPTRSPIQRLREVVRRRKPKV